MGGEPYWYFIKYQPDINSALQELRQREFKAGRYNPVIQFPADLFPLSSESPEPGAQHSSIEEALEASAADGTRSILDLNHISDSPDYETVTPIDNEVLRQLYNTTKPTREMIEENMDFFSQIERGKGIYFIIYKDGKPDEIFFAGVSFD